MPDAEAPDLTPPQRDACALFFLQRECEARWLGWEISRRVGDYHVTVASYTGRPGFRATGPTLAAAVMAACRSAGFIA
jgi:hypothetical protein